MSISTKIWSHVFAGAAGAAVAHFFDPDRGRARRARSQDLFLAAGRDMTRDVEQRARHVEGRLRGARAKADGRGQMDASDDHLIKQGIRQALASSEADTSDVVIDVTEGVVGLRGKASSVADQKRIELVTMAAPGVEEVQSWLHLPGEVAPNKALAMRAGADI